MFNMFEDECLISLEYNECHIEELMCKSSNFDPESGKLLPVEDCSHSLYEIEFWSQLREEPALDLNPKFAPIVKFFDKYHGFHEDQCKWRTVQAKCSAFEILAQNECKIEFGFNECHTDEFMCRYDYPVAGNEIESSDCNDRLMNRDFWA
jgi:hypothetical protein